MANYGAYNGWFRGMGATSAGGRGWPAGTQLHYHNTGLLHNSFSGYSDSSIQAAIAASGLFVPNSVLVTTHSSGFLGLSGSDIDIVGILPVDVSETDAMNVIENLMPNWFVRNPQTATYAPAPSISIGGGTVPGPAATPATVDPASYGVLNIWTDPTNADSWFDVLFSDGTYANYDQDAVLQSGQPHGIVEIGEYGTGDTAELVYAQMSDGAVLYFNLDGSYNSFAPASSGSNNASVIGLPVGNRITAPPPPGQPKGKDWDAVLSSFGLDKLPVALGVGAGTVVLVGGVLLYLFATGGLKPGR